MKGIFALLLFWLIGGNGWTQIATEVPNDLLELEMATSDEARCEALNHACFNSSQVDPAAGIGYGNRAIAIAKANDLEKLRADAHNSLGLCYDTQGKADSAMFHFELSMVLLEKTGHRCDMAAVYLNIGNAQKRILKYTGALASFTKGLEIQEECKELGNRGMVLQALGSSYNALKQYEKAIEYFDAAIEMEKEHGMESRLGPIYHSKANSLLGLRRLEEASELLKMAISNYDKSGNEYNMAYSFESIAHLQVELQNFDSAIFYSNKALNIFQKMEATMDIVYEQLFLSDVMIMSKDYKGAKEKLEEVLAITIAQNLPHDRMHVMENFTQIYAGEGDYKTAFDYQSKYMRLKDSLNVDEQKAEMTAMVNKFETDKRDRQIALEQAQNAQIQAESERQKQQKYFLLFGVVFLGILIMVLINRYLQKQRNARDLTLANVQIAREKERAERSERMKKEFLSNMSHEIRTPVNAINGLSRLLLDKQHDQSTREFIEAINHSGENLMVILNDVLDMAKVEAGKLDIARRPMNLATEVDILTKMYRLKADRKGIELLVDYDTSIPQVLMGDAPRLAQVLGNIVSNAIKFTDEGKVALQVKNVGGDRIYFAVRDTGIGISKADQERIFQGFEQVNNKDTASRSGTGLGLAIAQNLVRLMGGDLLVESQLGTGSRFHFTLTMESTGESASVEEASTLSLDQRFHIIVAEDNEYNFWVARGSLEKYLPNSIIYHARTGREVLTLLDEDDYDLIIMDVQMPELDGLEATGIIREKNNTIPILGLTASVLNQDMEKCLSVGMNVCVQKPFSEVDFVKALSELLGLNPQPKLPTKSETKANHSLQFKKWIPGYLERLEDAFEHKDLAAIKHIAHQMRPLIEANEMENVRLSLIRLEEVEAWNSSLIAEIETVFSTIRSRLDDSIRYEL